MPASKSLNNIKVETESNKELVTNPKVTDPIFFVKTNYKNTQ